MEGKKWGLRMEGVCGLGTGTVAQIIYSVFAQKKITLAVLVHCCH